MSTYLERGHSLTTTRGKNDIFKNIPHKPDPYIEKIDQWQKAHRHHWESLQEFSNWWKDNWVYFDSPYKLLQYLRATCIHILDRTPGCECEVHFREYRRK